MEKEKTPDSSILNAWHTCYRKVENQYGSNSDLIFNLNDLIFSFYREPNMLLVLLRHICGDTQNSKKQFKFTPKAQYCKSHARPPQ